jgi:SAM-dependent methyltransferase
LETLEYRLGSYRIICPRGYYLHDVYENYILDVYRTNDLLNEGDLVLDLGAGIGDFSVLASKKVGNRGQVIAVEPDVESYEILKSNIGRNRCQNVIPMNIGVGSESGEKEITFRGRKYRFNVSTLENIIEELHISRKINFIKMDIEGCEAEVVNKSLEMIKESNVISVESHGTKDKLDKVLLPNGFSFRPVTMNYIYKKLIKHLFIHPFNFYKALKYEINDNPKVLRGTVTGFNIAKEEYFVIGSYVKDG